MTRQSGGDLGERLRRLRAARGLTQKQLAGDRYADAYVSQIESGRKQPSLDAVVHFAETLGVHPDLLTTGADPEEATRLKLQISEAKLAIYTGDASGAVESLGRVARLAQRQGLAEVRAMALETTAFAHERLGDLAAARELYESAERLWSDYPLPRRVGCVTGLARLHQQDGQVREAAHLLETFVLELKRARMEEPAAMMRAHASLIGIYFALGLTQRAIEVAQEAQVLEVRVAEPEHVACMNVNVARVHLHEGRPEEATAALVRAEEIFSAFGWKQEVARVHTALAIVDSKQDDRAAARDHLMQALGLIAGTSPLDEARILTELGRIERAEERFDEAVPHLERAVALLEDVDVRERALCLRELALCSFDRPRRAEKLLKESIDLYRLAKDRTQTADSLRRLGDLYAATGQVEKMAAAYREGIEETQDISY